MKIGVISDTHGLVKDKVFQIFKDVDLIIHAGDIGNLKVIGDLLSIAPVEAVWGNMDPMPVRDQTREKLVLNIEGLTLGVSHGGGSPYDIIERLQNMFYQQKVDIIIYGHTHKPHMEKIKDIFFFNPGYGRETVGILEVKESKYTYKIFKL